MNLNQQPQGSIPRPIEPRGFFTGVKIRPIIIGALCTILGGYLAGWLARAEEIKHGALVGAVSLIIGFLQSGMAGEASPVPYWHELLGYLLAIPAGALGGSLAQGRARPSIPRSTQGRRL